MRVKITRCWDGCWYKHHIGDIFDVRPPKGREYPRYYVTANNKCNINNGIDFEDCELMPDNMIILEDGSFTQVMPEDGVSV